MVLKASSQNYVPFDFSSGEWFCSYFTKGGLFSQHGTYYASESLKFYCSGDTTINSIDFKKLYYKGTTYSQIMPLTVISGYMGAIRNDTTKKKVWFMILI